jgi:hypothetical protein
MSIKRAQCSLRCRKEAEYVLCKKRAASRRFASEGTELMCRRTRLADAADVLLGVVEAVVDLLSKIMAPYHIIILIIYDHPHH